MPTERITRKRIDELLRFLPVFDVPGLVVEPVARVGLLGFAIYDETVNEFFDLASQPCWWDNNYDLRSIDGAFQSDSRANEMIATASLEQIKGLVTYCFRGEKFCSGHWAHMINTGRIAAILRRLQKLRDLAPEG